MRRSLMLIKSILTHLRIFWLALNWIGKINIGSYVKYNGKRYMVSNGVSRPYWSLFIAEPHEYLEHIHQDDFKLIQTPREWWLSFKSGYRFYYGYWYRIWRDEPITKIPYMTIDSWLRGRNK